MKSATLAAVLALLPAVGRAQIVHDAIGCMVAGQFPVVEATLEPGVSATRARVYFKSKSRSARYFIEMQQQGEKLVGKLPKPRLEDKAFRYSVRVSGVDSPGPQTPEFEAKVVSDESECPTGASVAPLGPGDAVTVFDAASGKVTKWPKFRGH